MKFLSIICPVYFNEDSLPALFEKLVQIEKALFQKKIKTQFVFVDDGSKDGSLELLKNFKKNKENCTVVKLTRNFGVVSAVKTAYEYVEGDSMVLLSADLQDNPDLILKMADKWLAGAKYVICVRSEREDPLSSKIFSFIYYKLLRFFVIKDYPDAGFDLALMDKTFLPHLKNSGKHINISLFPYWLGYKPEILYYKRIARAHGKSRHTFKKKLKYFIDSIFGLSIGPARFVSSIGVLASLAGFCYGIIIIVLTLIGNVHVPGFAAIATLISFFSGLILIMLGIISEYAWRIFDEINKNPTAVIDEVF